MRTWIWLAFGLLPALSAISAANAAPAPRPALDLGKLTRIEVDPAQILLDDPRARQRVLVTGYLGDQRVDLTDVAKLEIQDSKIARLQEAEIAPQADGETQLTATAGPCSAKVAVRVSNSRSGRPVSFPGEIVPVFSKLSCNSGGCHGKSGGQNGFALSLLGFQPADDYDFLVKEGRGRRVFPAAPEQSLLLRKAAGTLPHGGGKLLRPGDENYQLLLDWIHQGMPYGSEKDRVVARLEIFPATRIMSRQSSQRLRVTATFNDGRSEDVSRFVQFQSNDDAVASVDAKGTVTTHGLAGESAIMARYQGRVAVFRATVPLDPSAAAGTFVARNFIDQFTSRKWHSLGLVPSAPSSDGQFLRRLHLDLCGKLPNPELAKQFAADTDPGKRDRLIDQLLASPEYASFMALKWSAILQNKRIGKEEFAPGTHAMSAWLKDAMHRDMPYDQFVRTILTAEGTPETCPPVVWFRVVRTNEENVDNIAQLFLGTRIQCARCHHHPFEKWGQEDYFALAAFFARVGRKTYDTFPNGQANEAVFVARTGEVKHPRTGKVIPAHGLDAAPVEIPPGSDPRQKLAEWLTAPSNPFFARALVNRLWGHFFSRGLVEPIDDMRVTNPPVNPELLDALAADFIRSGFRLQHVVRTICRSATYQLSSEPTPANLPDKQNFARYYPKRLPAEVLLDSVDWTTAAPTSFGFPSEMRAVDLPDEQVASYFLDIFGRPNRTSSCECERNGEANLSQALHLLNSSEVHAKLIADTGRAALLAKDPRPDADKIRELFLIFFTRQPTAIELQTALEHVTKKADKKEAYQNIIWALLNTKEFQFNT